MKKIIRDNVRTEYSLDNIQEKNDGCESITTCPEEIPIIKKQNISTVSPHLQKPIKTIDGVTPFLEAYSKGIRERKGGFTISCKENYDVNGDLNFEYAVKD